MNVVKDKIWFLREGLFAKYVIALVGLVVFVLAVNGAMETWISYRGIKTSLTDAMSEKAEATAKRIEQSMSDLERQISWVTRAYSDTIEHAPRRLCRNCCARCRRSASSRCSTAQRPRAAARHAPDGDRGQQRRFLPRCALHRHASRAAPASRRPISATSGRSCRSRWRIPARCRRHRRRNRSSLPRPTSSAMPQVGKVGGRLCRRSAKGEVLASSAKGPEDRQGSLRACRRSPP